MNACCDRHSTKFCPECGRRITRNGDGPGAMLLARLDRTIAGQKSIRARFTADDEHSARRRTSIDETLATLATLREWVQKHVDAEAASLSAAAA